jgi:putative lipoprotein
MTPKSLLALLVSLSLWAACGAAEKPAAAASISGVVTYRERIALPPDAVVVVRLEAAGAPERPARKVAEVSIPTAGRQVPIGFTLPYPAGDIQAQKRYLVRATISAADRTLFVTRAAYPVLTKGAPTRLEILVQPAGSSRRPSLTPTPDAAGLAGTSWTLLAPGDGTSSANGSPTLALDPEQRRISGFTGCNRFMGTYALSDDGGLTLEPSGMTLMACADEVAARETAFLEALRATTASRIVNGQLELLAGDRVLLHFASSPPAATTPPSH